MNHHYEHSPDSPDVAAPDQSRQARSRAGVDSRPRGRGSDPDWTVLGEQLIAAFPDVERTTVIRELVVARSAAEDIDLPMSDRLDTAEVVTRHQLLLLSGTLVDNARSDPRSSSRRSRSKLGQEGQS